MRTTALQKISQDITDIFIYIILPIYLIHLIMNIAHTATTIPGFWSSSISDQMAHLASGIFMVIPFRENTRQEIRQEAFQLLLHLSGNLAMLYASKLYYLRDHLALSVSYNVFDLYFVLPVVLCNISAGGLLILYYAW